MTPNLEMQISGLLSSPDSWELKTKKYLQSTFDIQPNDDSAHTMQRKKGGQGQGGRLTFSERSLDNKMEIILHASFMGRSDRPPDVRKNSTGLFLPSSPGVNTSNFRWVGYTNALLLGRILIDRSLSRGCIKCASPCIIGSSIRYGKCREFYLF